MLLAERLRAVAAAAVGVSHVKSFRSAKKTIGAAWFPSKRLVPDEAGRQLRRRL
jgi:hypothetical protein